MHELTVTQSILSIVLEKARGINACKVTKVDILVGILTGYIPDCIQLQFDILSRHTEASGARLIFHQPPAKLHCRKCDRDFKIDQFELTCPECRALEVDIISGSELYVENMEVELA